MPRVSAVSTGGRRSSIMLRAVSHDISTRQLKTGGAAPGDHAMEERAFTRRASNEFGAACPVRLRRLAAGDRWPLRTEHAGNEPSNNSVDKA